MVNVNNDIKPKQGYYQKLQVNEFWTYVGHKKNKVWLVYDYDLDTSEIVAFVWGKSNLNLARELRAKLDALGINFG